jgi:Nuclease A inhibitor-like protein
MENKKHVKYLEKAENFKENLLEIIENLRYISETDGKFTYFEGTKIDKISNDNFLTQIGCSPNVSIEQQNFEEFFLRLTTIKEWFGEIEKQNAKKFIELQEFLKINLKELKVFRTGKIKIDIYIVGINTENYVIGVKTNAVET